MNEVRKRKIDFINSTRKEYELCKLSDYKDKERLTEWFHAYNIQLTLQDIYDTTTVQCDMCYGEGTTKDCHDGTQDCGWCAGTGYVVDKVIMH